MTEGALGANLRKRFTNVAGAQQFALRELVRDGPVPRYRVIVGVDVERSTERTDHEKVRLRDDLYAVLGEVVRTCGLAEADLGRWEDRGDGVLLLVPAADHLPRALLLRRFGVTLERILARHNARYPERAFRLRVVVHVGEVYDDGRGYFGHAVDIACRLLDAAELRVALAAAPAALVLAVSDVVYHSVVRQGHRGIDPQGYRALINLTVGGCPQTGWVAVDP